MSEDEFDQLSDPFSGVDWSTVPELASAPSAPHPDRHQTPHAAELPQSTHRAEPSEEDAATEYSFDDLDDAFLAHIDEVESRMRTQDSARGGSESAIASRFFHCENIAHTPNVLPSTLQASRPNERSSASVQSTSNGKLDRTHSYSSSKCIGPMSVSETENRPPRITRELSSPSVRESPPKRHKGKQKESPRAILREFLNGFEEEMTCPICCDIFASAHLGNPCGHSFCGECGLRWMKKNREAPTCAICRASLSADAPMIPNFAMDNAVDKHVHALRASAIEGWGDGEIKFIEWQARKTRWKADSTKQKSKKKATVSLAMSTTKKARTKEASESLRAQRKSPRRQQW
ncbi:hypothetical protein BC834DRAFT_849979 [Gloeopeniophorella convolvens]|nr:hypothetical protein BC834DRAFT_849979 [Gloeopeniophorella convolvens]